MTHGTDPNIASQKKSEERNGSMSSAIRSQEASRAQLSSPVHEISNESIQVRQAELRRDSAVDAQISDHLEQYRETLHRSSPSVTTTSKTITDNSVEKAHDTAKSASRRSKKKQKGKHDSLQEVSLLEDPLGFLANLLTKLERALLRSLRGEQAAPLPAATSQPTMAIPLLKRRKKKKRALSTKGPHRGTQLTTLYHLEHLNNELHALDISSEQNTNEATHNKN